MWTGLRLLPALAAGVLLLAGCGKSSGPESPGEEGAEGVRLAVLRTLDFAPAPLAPSVGGLLDEQPGTGLMAFVDRTAPYEILLFDRAGAFLRSMGGRGDGPGEYREISGLRFDAEGRLWVLSQRGARLDLYERNLEEVRTLRPQLRVHRIAPLGGGQLAAIASEGRRWSVGILTEKDGFRPLDFPPEQVTAEAPSAAEAELVQLASDGLDRFWVAFPHGYRIWAGTLAGTMHPLVDEAPRWFLEDYTAEVKEALRGMIDTGGATILAMRYDGGPDALWITAGVPDGSVTRAALEAAVDPFSIAPLLIDHVVDAVSVRDGTSLCSEEFGFLEVAHNSHLQYRVASERHLEVVGYRIPDGVSRRLDDSSVFRR